MGSQLARRCNGGASTGFTRKRAHYSAIAAAAVAALAGVQARGNVWVVPGSGSWNVPANWNPAAVPDGVDAVADFSQVDLTADATVNLVTGHTVGTLDFGDTIPATAGGWILSDATQQTLTLATSTGDATIFVGPLGTGKAATVNSLVKVAAGQVVDKTGSGTLIFTNTGNAATTGFAGILDIQAGIFQVAATTALPNFDPTTIRIDGGTMRFSAGATTSRIFTLGAAGGTLDFAAASTFSGTGSLLFNGSGARTLTVLTEAGASSVSSLIGDAAAGSPTSLVKSGAGSLILGNAGNVFTGNLTVSAGNLTTTTLGGGNVSVAQGSTLTLSRTTSQSLSGSFTGGGSFVQTGGAGTVNLANASFTGSTTIQNGTYVNNNTATSNIVLGTVAANLNYALLSLNADFTGPVGTTGGGLTFAGSGASGGFVAPAAGTRIVNLGGAGAAVTLNAGGFYAGSTAGMNTDARFKFGDAAGTALGTVDFQNAIVLNSRLFKAVTDGSAQFAAILSGNISGAGDPTGAITKFGNGNLELTGNNNYSGATTNGGGAAIVLGSANAFSQNSNFVLAGVSLSNNSGVLGLAAGYGDLNATLGTSGGQVGFGAGLSGGFAAFGGNRSVTLNGAGSTLVWGSTPSFISSGQNLVLSITSADAAITFNNPLDLNGANRSIYVNRGTGTTVDAVLPQPITNSSATASTLTKNGPGVLVISANNTYSGTTTIASGTVRVNNVPASAGDSGTGPGAVTIANGATLGGSGTIAGPVTVSASGTITAGPNGTIPAALTTGAQTWAATGRYVAKVAADGSANDQLLMSGLTVPTSGVFAVQLVGLGGTAAPTALTNAGILVAVVDDPTQTTQNGVFQNAITAGNLTLSSPTNTVTTASGSAPQLREFDTTDGLGNPEQELFAFDPVAAPEPTSLLLAAAAVAPLALRRRRRCHRPATV